MGAGAFAPCAVNSRCTAAASPAGNNISNRIRGSARGW